MSDKNDGGPAFPGAGAVGPSGDLYTSNDTHGDGMTLRDWFAGQALTGLLAGNSPAYNVADTDENALYVANRAYRIADFMLVERS